MLLSLYMVNCFPSLPDLTCGYIPGPLLVKRTKITSKPVIRRAGIASTKATGRNFDSLEFIWDFEGGHCRRWKFNIEEVVLKTVICNKSF
jgi:hypothetical protein